jgi:hypothetical protein
MRLKEKAMRSYDVHVYAQVRIKIEGVEAEDPKAAIGAIAEDEDLLSEIHRLIDVDNAGGRIASIEFQGEAIPEGWLVDPKDENEAGHGDGITFDADPDGNPVLMFDPSNMPNPMQLLWAASTQHDVKGHADARGAASAISRTAALDGALFEELSKHADAASADAAIAAIIEKLQSFRKAVSKSDGRADWRIPVGVADALKPHGMVASFVEAEDGGVDDAIEIRRESDGAEMADVQICQDGSYCAGMWTDDRQLARAYGHPQTTAALAAEDAVALLKRHRRI